MEPSKLGGGGQSRVESQISSAEANVGDSHSQLYKLHLYAKIERQRQRRRKLERQRGSMRVCDGVYWCRKEMDSWNILYGHLATCWPPFPVERGLTWPAQICILLSFSITTNMCVCVSACVCVCVCGSDIC